MENHWFYFFALLLCVVSVGAQNKPIVAVTYSFRVNEGSPYVFTFQLDSASDVSTSFKYNLIDGTAIAGINFIPINGTVIFSPSITVQTITVETIRDDIYDPLSGGSRTFILQLSNPSGLTILISFITARIFNLDSVPVLNLSYPTVVDENTPINVLFSLSRLSTIETRVNYSLSSNTALKGFNFIDNNGSILIPPNSQNTTISIITLNDNTYDSGNIRTFSITLDNPVNCIVDSTKYDFGIKDIDTVPVVLVDYEHTVEEGDNFTITLTLSKESYSNVAVSYYLVSGAARPGVHYVNLSQTIEFPARTTNAVLSIITLNDNTYDGGNIRTFTITLENVVDGVAYSTAYELGIKDIDIAPALILDYENTVEEGDNFTVTFTLSKESYNTIGVYYYLVSGSANPGVNYINSSQMIEFSPHTTIATLNIITLSDNTYDGGDVRSFYLTLDNLANVVVYSTIYELGVRDIDTAPVLQVDYEDTVEEGDNLTVILTLSKESYSILAVSYYLVSGAAKPGVNYVNSSKIIEFPAHTTNTTFSIMTLNDNTYDGGNIRGFTLTLENLINSVAYSTNYELGIKDTDTEPELQVVYPYSVEEGDNFTVTLVLSKESYSNTAVYYHLVSGTAKPGVNYVNSSQKIEFPSRTTGAAITISTIIDDIYENGLLRHFTLVFSDPVGILVPHPRFNLSIKDTDSTPILIVHAIDEVDEGEPIPVVLSLSRQSSVSYSVKFTLIPGTAKANINYNHISLTVSMPASAETSTVRIRTKDDDIYDSGKTRFFTISLSDPNNVVLGNSLFNATIRDTDPAPTLNVTTAPVSEGQVAVVQLKLSGKTYHSEIAYTIVAGTAIQGVHFSNTSGIFVFDTINNKTNVTIPTFSDGIVRDGPLTFRIYFHSASVILPAEFTSVSIIDTDITDSSCSYNSSNHLTCKGSSSLRILQVLLQYPNTIQSTFNLVNQRAPSPQTQLFRISMNDRILRAFQSFSGSGITTLGTTSIPDIVGVSCKTLLEYSVTPASCTGVQFTWIPRSGTNTIYDLSLSNVGNQNYTKIVLMTTVDIQHSGAAFDSSKAFNLVSIGGNLYEASLFGEIFGKGAKYDNAHGFGTNGAGSITSISISCSHSLEEINSN